VGVVSKHEYDLGIKIEASFNI